MQTSLPRLGPRDALILVDVQRDFCPGGALPVPGGHEVVSVLNEWIDHAVRSGATVAASRDWHPKGHVSFSERGGPWPEHCVQNTPGAEFHPELRLPRDFMLISKGHHPDRDALSAFDSTDLAPILRARGVERIFVGGLAQDVCVRATVLDGIRHGFETHLIANATRPVDEREAERSLLEMQRHGAVLEQAAP